MSIIIEIILAIIATVSAQSEPELIAAPVIVDPISTLSEGHELNGCAVGWPCADGVDVSATEVCTTEDYGPGFGPCVGFSFDGGTSVVLDADGNRWPIHVWEDGSYTVVIVPCGGDADCAEKNPMIAEHSGY